MAQKIHLWGVTSQDILIEIPSSEISREKRLEDWLESNISMLDPSLLVIGRQVRTDFGGEIDLLCLDSLGNTVVIELKKSRTPRDVTAQVLEYASWVKDLTDDQIIEKSDRYLAPSYLADAFQEKFSEGLPEELNSSHRSLIVAEDMDTSTERIVRYLAEMDVPINVATVQHFQDADGREILAQVFLVEPEEVPPEGSPTPNRPPYVSKAQIERISEQRGVGDLYKELSAGALGIMRASSFGKDRRGFQVETENGWRTVFVVQLGDSDADRGLMFRLNGIRLMNHLELTSEQLDCILPEGMDELRPSEWSGVTLEEKSNWKGYKGYFQTEDEVKAFLDGIRTNMP